MCRQLKLKHKVKQVNYKNVKFDSSLIYYLPGAYINTDTTYFETNQFRNHRNGLIR
jgi:hypothetical protein